MSSRAREWLLYTQYLLLERSPSSDSQSLTGERGKRLAASWSLIFRGRIWTDMLLCLLLSCLSSRHRFSSISDGNTSSQPSHSHTAQTDPVFIPTFPDRALRTLIYDQFQTFYSEWNFSLLPALALVETWLAPLQPSWVETFSFLSLTCSVLFRLSILSRCPPLHFYFNSYYFLLQNIRMFEVGLTSYISHQPFEFYSFTCPPPRALFMP